MIDSCTTAPGSISLLGQMRTLALTVEAAPTVTSLPMTLPSSRRQPFLIVTDLHTTVPRGRELPPTELWSQTIEFESFTPESTVVYAPRTAGPFTQAPPRTLAPAPMKTGPSMRAPEKTSASG